MKDGQRSLHFRSSENKEITDLRTLGWPIQSNGTFLHVLKSRIIRYPVQFLKHITCKDYHAYLLSNPRLLGKIQYTEKYGLKKVSSVGIYLQILFHFSQ